MDRWGEKMVDAIYTISRMSAIGMDIPENTFSDIL
jgi:hypothetical protein